MLVRIQIDKNNVIIGYATVGDISNSIEVETDIPSNELLKYKYVDGSFILNTEPTEKELKQELSTLKQYLIDTDYTVIKCQELGLVYVDTYPDVSVERTRARDRINELEEILLWAYLKMIYLLK